MDFLLGMMYAMGLLILLVLVRRGNRHQYVLVGNDERVPTSPSEGVLLYKGPDWWGPMEHMEVFHYKHYTLFRSDKPNGAMTLLGSVTR